MKSTVQTMRDAINDAKIGITYVEMPMTFVEENDDGLPVFKFNNGVELPMMDIGVGYLHERFKNIPYATYTKMRLGKRYAEIADTTSQSTDWLVAALYQGAIVGLMSNYHPVDHNHLLDIISVAHLENNIVWWSLTKTGLRIDITVRSAKVAPEETGKLITALSISNGHSGHYALRYSALVRIDDYEWLAPLSTRRRHLSRVGLALDAINNSAHLVEDIRMEDRLRATNMSEVRAVLATIEPTVRQERLIMQVLETNPSNASEFVATMGVYASTVGYRAAVNGVIDPILSKVSGL